MKQRFVRVVGIISAVMLMVPLFLTGCGGSADKPSGAGENNAQAAVSAGTQANAPAGTPAEAQASTPAETSAEKIKITFWHNYGADKETPYFTDTIIPKFKEKYPNIEIEAVAQGGDQYSNLITTALGTNSAPDCARLDSTDVATFANQDGLLALNEMEGFAALKDSVYEGAMSSDLFKGKYYGFPIDTNCKAAVVNLAALEKLGFGKPPKTMEEFIEASKKLSPKVPAISVSSVGDWDFLPYFWLFGGVLSDGLRP